MALRIARRCGAVMFAMAACATATAAPPGNPETGRLKVEAERCNECHGAQGFAKLEGQHAPYLLAQLQHYRDGRRKHDVMRLNTRDLDDADLRDIAAFYASLPSQAAPRPPDEHPSAHALFTQGDAGRKITACAICHGPSGRGAAPIQALAPRLAGQDLRYLELQLQDWRSGWRVDTTGGLMNEVTRQLTDAEIKALANYLAHASP